MYSDLRDCQAKLLTELKVNSNESALSSSAPKRLSTRRKEKEEEEDPPLN